MARPYKPGLEYFPFDVDLLKDNKLRRPKMKYGYLATAIYIALLTLLYEDKGYYIPYATQNEKEDCVWYVLNCLQGKYQPDANTVAEVIEELVACELFSGDRYPENITSKRSQSVYYSATVERKSIVIDDAIWLLSLDEMKNLSEKHVYYLSKVTQPNNRVNRPKNEVNRPNNPQSKEKDSIDSDDNAREKKSQVKQIPQSNFGEQLRSFCKKFGVEIDTNSSYVADMDFAELSKAYADSRFFLQNRVFAKYLSWIVKNYESIVCGKYKDQKQEDKQEESYWDESADRLNAVFEKLNEEL